MVDDLNLALAQPYELVDRIEEFLVTEIVVVCGTSDLGYLGGSAKVELGGWVFGRDSSLFSRYRFVPLLLGHIHATTLTGAHP